MNQNYFYRAMSEMLAKKMIEQIFGGLDDESTETGKKSNWFNSIMNAIGTYKGGGGGGGGSSASGIGDFFSSTTAARGGVFNGPLREIRRFARGGLIDRPMLIAAGGGSNDPGGGMEAIIPIQGGAVRGKFTGGGGTTVVNHYHITTCDPASFDGCLEKYGTGRVASIAAAVAPGAVMADIADGGPTRSLVYSGY